MPLLPPIRLTGARVLRDGALHDTDLTIADGQLVRGPRARGGPVGLPRPARHHRPARRRVRAPPLPPPHRALREGRGAARRPPPSLRRTASRPPGSRRAGAGKAASAPGPRPRRSSPHSTASGRGSCRTCGSRSGWKPMSSPEHPPRPRGGRGATGSTTSSSTTTCPRRWRCPRQARPLRRLGRPDRRTPEEQMARVRAAMAQEPEVPAALPALPRSFAALGRPPRLATTTPRPRRAPSTADRRGHRRIPHHRPRRPRGARGRRARAHGRAERGARRQPVGQHRGRGAGGRRPLRRAGVGLLLPRAGAGGLAARRHRRALLAAAWEVISTAPARIAGLADRGALAPGQRADLVVVNPDTRTVEATIAGGRMAHLSGGAAQRFMGSKAMARSAAAS